MASLKFFLKNPESENETLIQVIFQYGYFEIDPASGRKKYKFLKLSTGEKINPKFWNKLKCRARETKSYPRYPELNTSLGNLENTIFNVYRRLKNDSIYPTPSKLKAEVIDDLNIRDKKIDSNDYFGFFDLIKVVIQESKNGTRLTPNGNRFSPFTIKGYITTFNHLKRFQKHRNTRIDFSDIDMSFYNELVNWFYSQNKAKNTVGNHIKNVKVFMSEAIDRGLTDNNIFKSKKFKFLKEDTDTIYLNNEELDKMIKLDLSEMPQLELVRDNFILDCHIGLRIADFNNLKKDHIIEVQGVKMISIVLQKTETPVKIPLHRHALSILEKYNYVIKTFTDQTMNRLIKRVGELAEIDEEITTIITRGGKRVTNIHKKFEKITNHTARRSFATNLYYADIPNLAIMKMTGHKTEKSFLRYIRINEEENALKISQHPYFAQ